MPVTIVIGGQYGSEGKGKVVALLGNSANSPWLVRCGGPNSGHSVTIAGQTVVLRQVPSCANPSEATFCLSAGCVVDEEILLRELDLLGIPQDRIIVDPRTVIVTQEDRDAEQRSLEDIASTCSGTGAALVRRMSRGAGTKLGGESLALRSRCRIEVVTPLLHNALERNRDVIVEGTQGFGLSPFARLGLPLRNFSRYHGRELCDGSGALTTSNRQNRHGPTHVPNPRRGTKRPASRRD